MVLYASGTMLNDVFDFEVDRVERPGRPVAFGPSFPAHRRLDRVAWAWSLGPCLALASGSARRAVAGRGRAGACHSGL